MSKFNLLIFLFIAAFLGFEHLAFANLKLCRKALGGLQFTLKAELAVGSRDRAEGAATFGASDKGMDKETTETKLIKLLESAMSSQKSALDEMQIKSALIEYFNPAIRGGSALPLSLPLQAKSLFEVAFNYYKAKGDYRFLDKLLSSYLVMNDKYPAQANALAHMTESVEFDFPTEFQFPATAYSKELPAIPMIVVSKLRAPTEIYTLDILISFSKGDTYWDANLLKALAEQAYPNLKSSEPIVALLDPMNGHSDEFDYFDLNPQASFLGRRTVSWATGASESVSELLSHLGQQDPLNEDLQRFRKTIRAPLGLAENPENIDENSLISFRIMSVTPISLKAGHELLQRALVNARASMPRLDHGGFSGAWNWLRARFESDNSKATVVFREEKVLAMAQEMGFDVKLRRKVIRELQRNFSEYMSGEKSIFSILRAQGSAKLPATDAEENALVIRLLDGFYKELSDDPEVDYLTAPKKLQGWIEKRFLSYLINSGNWPVGSLDSNNFGRAELARSGVPVNVINESIQQYLLSLSKRSLLLQTENGLYFLKGKKPNSIRVLGVTHDYDDPIAYLKAQNPQGKFSVSNLQIIKQREKRGFVDQDGNARKNVKITASSPLLFVADLELL